MLHTRVSCILCLPRGAPAPHSVRYPCICAHQCTEGKHELKYQQCIGVLSALLRTGPLLTTNVALQHNIRYKIKKLEQNIFWHQNRWYMILLARCLDRSISAIYPISQIHKCLPSTPFYQCHPKDPSNTLLLHLIYDRKETVIKCSTASIQYLTMFIKRNSECTQPTSHNNDESNELKYILIVYVRLLFD